MTNRMIRKNTIAAITMSIYFSGIEQMGPTFNDGFLLGLHLIGLTTLGYVMFVERCNL